MTRRNVLEGKRFGRLVVLAYLGEYRYQCRCDCGAEKRIFTSELRDGKTKSCGCLRKEVTGDNHRTHGLTKTRTYRIWRGALTRCENLNRHDYPRYGGKGITVCERWHAFENFLADMGECPEGHSLDRIDNTGNYEPGNCKWSTPKEQARNTTRNVYFEGKSLAEWAEELGVTGGAIAHRIKKFGNVVCPDVVKPRGKRGKK